MLMQGLAAMRDRLSMVVTGRASKTSQLEDRLKVSTAQLCISLDNATLQLMNGSYLPHITALECMLWHMSQIKTFRE